MEDPVVHNYGTYVVPLTIPKEVYVERSDRTILRGFVPDGVPSIRK